jgi:nicotinamide riboside transporter PnuC
MVKKLGLLGLLGFLGFLGLITGNHGWFGFYGFFGWFAFLREQEISDERLVRNYERGARNAFIFTTIGLTLMIVWISLNVLTTIITLTAVMTLIFLLNIVVFAVSVAYYNKKGD